MSLFGSSKKKEEKKEPEGYLGELSEKQTQCFDSFKAWVQSKGYDSNPWFTDTVYLKFCRARKFEVEKVIEMFSKYMDYRKENGINTILQDFTYDKRTEVAQHYPAGYCGVDKIGRPIYIERNGKCNPAGVWSVVDEPYLMRAFMHSYEYLSKHIMLACSAVRGEQVQQTLTILDMSGFGVSMMSKQMYALLKKGSGIMQDNYPENLGKMYIVNAPMLFTGVWAIAKGFIDERTAKKINILGSGYMTQLKEDVDMDQLIEFLGGNNKADLLADAGPWNDYDLVDGYEKGAVVGVRRKDQPDGPVFTPNDLERLPNPKLSAEAQTAMAARWAAEAATAGSAEEKK